MKTVTMDILVDFVKEVKRLDDSLWCQAVKKNTVYERVIGLWNAEMDNNESCVNLNQ